VNSATFSPDGSRIVTASSDKTARIWDVASGKEIAVLRGQSDSVLSADFSRLLRVLADFGFHRDSVLSAAFSPDGSRIVTGSWDGTVRIWDARLQKMSAKELLAEACARLAGVAKLTRDEMHLAGYADDMNEIDVCTSGQ
jgi:WD40 repeat protein